jgi:ribose 1,5-bisphosphokinase
LVLVVGPSGAGKDTLIALARESFAHDPNIEFPRRIVTRAPCAAEDHESVSEAAFERARSEGAFAFSWEAHGLRYALPIAIDADIRAGRTVVCNVSRALVQSLRERYAGVIVVLVTAPRELLAARLAGRARSTDGDAVSRVDRAAPRRDELCPDMVIENIGEPRSGARVLCDVIRGSARSLRRR